MSDQASDPVKVHVASRNAKKIGEMLRILEPLMPGVEIVDARGPGHGVASPEGTTAAWAALRCEGLVLDPVYTAKALAVLPSVVGSAPAIFWHTGGLLDAVAGFLCERP